MIEQELLLLGLLRDSPKHGYNIKIEIKKILSLFAGVELKSIYYPLRILEKKKLVVKRVLKPGNRPKRIVYALTKKGLERFDELLSKSLLDFKRPQFSLDLSLYFLHYLKPAIARRRLRARLHILNKISLGLEKMSHAQVKKENLSLRRILEHNFKALEAEEIFLSNLIKTI